MNSHERRTDVKINWNLKHFLHSDCSHVSIEGIPFQYKQSPPQRARIFLQFPTSTQHFQRFLATWHALIGSPWPRVAFFLSSFVDSSIHCRKAQATVRARPTPPNDAATGPRRRIKRFILALETLNQCDLYSYTCVVNLNANNHLGIAPYAPPSWFNSDSVWTIACPRCFRFGLVWHVNMCCGYTTKSSQTDVHHMYITALNDPGYNLLYISDTF